MSRSAKPALNAAGAAARPGPAASSRARQEGRKRHRFMVWCYGVLSLYEEDDALAREATRKTQEGTGGLRARALCSMRKRLSESAPSRSRRGRGHGGWQGRRHDLVRFFEELLRLAETEHPAHFLAVAV